MSETGNWVIDVDATSFEREVVQRSLTTPVVLDFWASWCEPCKLLTPLLEKRAREGNGRFVLAKVDVDRNAELAQAFRVQGIPAVLALVDGRIRDGFQGALGEEELDAFLDGIAPRGTTATEELVEQARALAGEGRGEEAVTLLRDHLRGQPDDSTARIALGDLLVDGGKPADARRVIEKLPEEARESPEAKSLVARIEFAETGLDLAELESATRARPEDAGARLALGKALVAAKRYPEGLEELLAAVRLGQGGAKEVVAEAKREMLEVFELLGLEDPVANDYRFKLSLELFA